MTNTLKIMQPCNFNSLWLSQALIALKLPLIGSLNQINIHLKDAVIKQKMLGGPFVGRCEVSVIPHHEHEWGLESWAEIQETKLHCLYVLICDCEISTLGHKGHSFIILSLQTTDDVVTSSERDRQCWLSWPLFDRCLVLPSTTVKSIGFGVRQTGPNSGYPIYQLFDPE